MRVHRSFFLRRFFPQIPNMDVKVPRTSSGLVGFGSQQQQWIHNKDVVRSHFAHSSEKTTGIPNIVSCIMMMAQRQQTTAVFSCLRTLKSDTFIQLHNWQRRILLPGWIRNSKNLTSVRISRPVDHVGVQNLPRSTLHVEQRLRTVTAATKTIPQGSLGPM